MNNNFIPISFLNEVGTTTAFSKKYQLNNLHYKKG